MANTIHPLAGKRPHKRDLITREQMRRGYLNRSLPELDPVKSGTSGHRGLTGKGFNIKHVESITQALADIRKAKGTFGPQLDPQELALLGLKGDEPLGPIILQKDVRFTSDFALETCAAIFAANGFKVIIQQGNRAIPTPVLSHRVLKGNSKGENVEAMKINASHNPPEDAGIGSTPLQGGPNTNTKPIDEKANYYMNHPEGIKRMSYKYAVSKGLIVEEDMITPYIEDLKNVVDIEAIKKLRFAVSPLGGAAHGIYEMINKRFGTQIEVVFPEPDPAGALSARDYDGKLRRDPSSEYVARAIKGIRAQKNVLLMAMNDNDSDRFGAEDSTGILNPNHILCVLFDYLARERGFKPDMGIGRTIATTHMLDLIAASYGRPVHETDVGFKHFVKGLFAGRYVLVGEESAGLCFPRLNGKVWVTEKDGITANLLMMEVIAKTGKDIGTLYGELEAKYGHFAYGRVDSEATDEKKTLLDKLAANEAEVLRLLGPTLAGRKVVKVRTTDGIKIYLEDGTWVLFRKSGTENKIKVYKEVHGDSLKPADDAAAEASEKLGLNLAVA